MAICSIRDYGAVGDGQTPDTAAIQKAIDACASAGGGTVLLPAGGVYLAGSFVLRSFIELRVERGARLIASERIEDYDQAVFKFGAESQKRLWIGAHGATDFAITGGGEIDGRCHCFFEADGRRTVPWRPAMTCFEDCRRIRIHDVILRNAANWTLHFTGCEDVVVTGVSILNPRDFPNCDGIDPDHCRNVRINNCHIEAGDDCIVIKNTAPFSHYGPTENIVVSNCTLESTSCAIKIGSESFNDFRNLVFTNCVIDDSNRGLGIQLRDSGNVENVIFSDMVVRTRLFEGKWWGAGEPIYVTALPRNHQTRPGRVRNIRFTNLMCHSECGAVIHGCDDSRIENLLLDNVRLELRRRTQHPAGRFDMRPCPVDVVYDYTPQAVIGQETPWGAAMHRRMPGVFAYQARNLALRHVHIDWDRPLPEEYSYALECHAVTGLAMDHFVGDAAHRGQEPAHVVE